MDLLGIKCDDRHVMGSQYMSAFLSLWKVGPLERVTSWVATGLLSQRLRARQRSLRQEWEAKAAQENLL